MSYSNQVLDHYENPRNVGSFEKGDDTVGTGMVGAPACGDVMKLQIKVNEQGVIEDAKFKTYGCGSATKAAQSSNSDQSQRSRMNFSSKRPSVTMTFAFGDFSYPSR